MVPWRFGHLAGDRESGIYLGECFFRLLDVCCSSFSITGGNKMTGVDRDRGMISFP